MKRIADKINEINKYLAELEDIVPENFEDYKTSIEKKAACERYVEKIMEAATDLAFLTIKFKRLRIPEDDSDAFSVLLENEIIDNALCKKLKDAKAMKNIIAHQYGKINDQIVFDAISEQLNDDISEYIGKINSKLKK